MAIDWDTVRVRLGASGRVRCEVGWRLARSFGPRLTDCDLWFVWAGRGHMQLEDAEIDLRPGVCLWMRPGRTYIAQQNPDDRLGVTFMHFDLLNHRGRPIRAHTQLPPEVHELADVHYADLLTRRIGHLMGPPPPSDEVRRAGDQLFTGLLMDLLAAPLRAHDQPIGGTPLHHYRMVMQMVSRITESPHDIPSVRDMAKTAGYCPDHFARLFKSITGQTPQSFAVHTRINRASQLLVDTDLPINRIADLLGYDQPAFFSRQFKQHMNTSPARYRAGPQHAD